MTAEQKEAKREYMYRYYREHREERLEYKRKYYQKHTEKIAESNRKYRQANQENYRKWRKTDPEKIYARNLKRRHRKKNLPCTLTEEEWQTILDQHFHRCHYCSRNGLPLHREHKIPMSKGGGYTKENIVPSCPSCNSSKHTKDYSKFVKGFSEERQTALQFD